MGEGGGSPRPDSDNYSREVHASASGSYGCNRPRSLCPGAPRIKVLCCCHSMRNCCLQVNHSREPVADKRVGGGAERPELAACDVTAASGGGGGGGKGAGREAARLRGKSMEVASNYLGAVACRNFTHKFCHAGLASSLILSRRPSGPAAAPVAVWASITDLSSGGACSYPSY